MTKVEKYETLSDDRKGQKMVVIAEMILPISNGHSWRFVHWNDVAREHRQLISSVSGLKVIIR